MEFTLHDIHVRIKDMPKLFSIDDKYIVGGANIPISVSISPFSKDIKIWLLYTIDKNKTQTITGFRNKSNPLKKEPVYQFIIPKLPLKGKFYLALALFFKGKEYKTCNDPTLKDGAWELEIQNTKNHVEDFRRLANDSFITSGAIEASATDDNIADYNPSLHESLGNPSISNEPVSDNFSNTEINNTPYVLPAFLFPCQIETRIKDNYLKIRIYPDQISIDSLERVLTENEKEDAIAFKNSKDDNKDSFSLVGWQKITKKYKPLRAAWMAKVAKNIPEKEIPVREQDKLSNPNVNILPDFFVAKLYLDNGKIICKRGNNIANEPLDLITFSKTHENIEKLDTDNTEQNIATEDGLFSENAKWVENYEIAFEKGMAITIPLEETNDNGENFFQDCAKIKKIIVYGLRSKKDEKPAKKLLSELLESHEYTKGIGFLKYGTNTNNTSDGKAGFSSLKNADQIYQRYFALQDDEVISIGTQNAKKLSDALGIDYLSLCNWENPGENIWTVIENFHEVLWYPTGENYLAKIYDDKISNSTKQKLKKLFIKHVRPLGYLPSFKIGKYPYGILPVTSLNFSTNLVEDNLPGHVSRSSTHSNLKDEFEQNLTGILNKLSKIWISAANSVRVPKVMNSMENVSDEEELCKILSTNASSSHYIAINKNLFSNNPYYRYTYSHVSEFISNVFGKEMPEIARLFAQNLILFQLPYPITEKITDPLPLVNDPTIENGTFPQYLWYLTNPNATINDFNILLYRLLYLAKEEYGKLFLPDKPFRVYVNEIKSIDSLKKTISDIKKSDLSISGKEQSKRLSKNLAFSTPIIAKAEKNIVDNYNIDVASSKPLLGEMLSTDEYANQKWKNFITTLAEKINEFDVESLFKGVIDSLSYRLDAWISSVANKRFEAMQENLSKSSKTLQDEGILLGYYGFVEDLELSETSREAPEGGFTHTFTHSQASTAAVLKNAYLDYNDSDENPYCINISSDRIRRALAVLQGMREQQELGALLGYEFERYLHYYELDQYIDKFREAFPLYVDTTVGEVIPRLVVNGYNLVKWLSGDEFENDERIRINNVLNGMLDLTEIVNGTEQLKDTLDAISDLLMHESVYQAIRGNYERCSAAMEIASGQPKVIEPESVSMNLPKIVSEKRICLLFDTDINPTDNPSARELAEPILAAWLNDIFGNLNRYGCCVKFYVKVNDEEVKAQNEVVLLSELSLHPTDFMYICAQKPGGGASEIDIRIKEILKQKFPILIEQLNENDKVLIEQLEGVYKNLIEISFESFDKNPNKPNTQNSDYTETEINQLTYLTGIDNAIELAHQILTTLGQYSHITPEQLFKEQQKKAGERQDENHILQLPIYNCGELYERVQKALFCGIEKLIGFGNNHDKNTFELIFEIESILKTLTRYIEILNVLRDISIQWLDVDATENDKIEIKASATADIDQILNGISNTSFTSEDLINTTIEEINSGKTTEEIHLFNNNQLLTEFAKSYKDSFCEDFINIEINNHSYLESLLDNLNSTLLPPVLKILNQFGLYFNPAEPITYIKVKPLLKTLHTRYTKYDLLSRKFEIIPNELEIEGEDENDKLNKVLNRSKTENALAKRLIDIFKACLKALFSENFIVMPQLILNPESPIRKSISVQSEILKGNSIERINLWMQQVAQTHKEVEAFEDLLMFLEAWLGSDNPINFKPHIATLPYETGKPFDAWQALDNDELGITNSKKERKSHSLGICAYSNIQSENAEIISGFTIDQWFEDIPLDEVDTAISFEADTPNQQPPNCCLLAVHPEYKKNDFGINLAPYNEVENKEPNWFLPELERIISETIDLAKIRAVDMASYPDVAGLFPTIYTPFTNLIKQEDNQ